MLQPIEQSLAHSIGCGSKARHIRETHAPAAPSAADDAHRIAAAARGIRFRLEGSHSGIIPSLDILPSLIEGDSLAAINALIAEH